LEVEWAATGAQIAAQVSVLSLTQCSTQSPLKPSLCNSHAPTLVFAAMSQCATQSLAQDLLLGALALALPHAARQCLLGLAAATRRRGGHGARRTGSVVTRLATGMPAAGMQTGAGARARRHCI
jgi:hypothetical protein